MNSTISKQVFEKIKHEEIKMRPSCYFKLVFGFWKILSLVFILMASVALSLAFYEFSLIEHSFTLAYILLAILLAFLASRFYRSSKLCCRHADFLPFVIISSVVLLAGLALYNLGLTKTLHGRIEAQREQREINIIP